MMSQFTACFRISEEWYHKVDAGPQYSEKDIEARSARFNFSGARCSLMKDAEHMESEYLYEDGIPMSSIWLRYSERR